MNETLKKELKYLGLKSLEENWTDIFSRAKKDQPSYHRFLTEIINTEYADKKERARQTRIKRANIPEMRVMETFPFSKQPRLKKRLVLDLYDSMRFITERQEMIFIGPTGCGKTGLATSFLVQAINQGYKGYFIGFGELARQLRQSKGDYSEDKILKRYQAYDILLIDELGYDNLDKKQAGLFFELMRVRNRKYTTLITSQLGFEEWNDFMQDEHLTSALLDRITANCTIFNMKECISIREKNIVHATKRQEEQ